MTTPSDLQNCFEANSLAPFFALKYAPPAMGKLASKGNYPNAAPKDQKYGSIIVVSSVASTYGGCWGPCYTMSSHAALGVVRAGVAVLKGALTPANEVLLGILSWLTGLTGSGVRINCISPGQIDVGINLKGFDMRGMKSQLPPASLQSAEVVHHPSLHVWQLLKLHVRHKKSRLASSVPACQRRLLESPASCRAVSAAI